jgi:hypothetical protein
VSPGLSAYSGPGLLRGLNTVNTAFIEVPIYRHSATRADRPALMPGRSAHAAWQRGRAGAAHIHMPIGPCADRTTVRWCPSRRYLITLHVSLSATQHRLHCNSPRLRLSCACVLSHSYRTLSSHTDSRRVGCCALVWSTPTLPLSRTATNRSQVLPTPPQLAQAYVTASVRCYRRIELAPTCR